MKIVLFIVLLVVAAKGTITKLAAIDYYTQMHAAIQENANNPINWAINLTAPANISQMIQVYCAKADAKTFNNVPLNDSTVLQEFVFNNKRTIFMFHGWISSTSASWATKLKANWVASGRSANLCIVDWSQLAYADYLTTALINIRLVADYIADTYLPWLQTQGLSYSDVILLGHSLGAQICGYIGQTRYNQIPFIIGMDPAGPLFEGLPEIYRLSADDATYVQIIHTCQGEYGYTGNCGDADFYLNLGISPQPGCTILTANDPVAIHCSHARALDIIIDSLLYTPQCSCKGIKCSNLLFYLFHLCDKSDCFGLDSAKTSGVFYASTSTTCTGSYW